MRACVGVILGLGVLFPATGAAWAGSLKVLPIGFEIAAPAATSTLHLTNEGVEPMVAQIRVFRWHMVDGQEKLEPTADVVVSPPLANIQPKSENIVRIVRVTKAPVTEEESYRVIADEIPTSQPGRGVTLSMAMRYSLPAFFVPKAQTGANLAWSIERKDGNAWLVATNSGDRREKLSVVTVSDPSGRQIVVAKGLAGYALAHSSLRLAMPTDASRINTSGTVSISANGDTGPINATAQQTQASR